LGPRFGHSKDEAKAVMAKLNVTKPTNEQLKEGLDLVEEEHHMIFFLYKSDRQRYGKLSKKWK